jgi:hypothetical protein
MTISRRTARTAGALTVAAALACLGGSVSAQSISTNGTIIVTGQVKIVSGISPSAVSGEVLVVLEAGQAGDVNQYIITAPVTLTWSGNNGSGTVTLPYSWTYESGGNIDRIGIYFIVSANLATYPYAENGAGIAIPASGNTTTLILPASM